MTGEDAMRLILIAAIITGIVIVLLAPGSRTRGTGEDARDLHHIDVEPR
jgi:hypothetical protein